LFWAVAVAEWQVNAVAAISTNTDGARKFFGFNSLISWKVPVVFPGQFY